MKLLKVAAIAAIVFSGSALAGVVPQYGGGGGNHGGGGNNSCLLYTSNDFHVVNLAFG